LVSNVIAVNKMEMAKGKICNIFVIRLQRNEDLIENIKQVCRKYKVKNGVIISMIRSSIPRLNAGFPMRIPYTSKARSRF
jgi:hypothetical protein